MRPCPDHHDPVYQTIDRYLVLDCLQCGVPIAGEVRGLCNVRGLIKSTKDHIHKVHPPWVPQEMIPLIESAVHEFNSGFTIVEFDVFRIRDI